MLTQKEIIGTLRRNFPFLRDNYGVKRMGLFGSFAKGIQREDSDIDILVEFEKPVGFKFIEFAEYIKKLLDKKVDILTPEGIKGIRLEKVAKDIEKSVVYV